MCSYLFCTCEGSNAECVCVLGTVISSCLFDLYIEDFLDSDFDLRSILSVYFVYLLAGPLLLFMAPFECHIIFHPFTFILYMSTEEKCVSYKQHVIWFYFYPFSHFMSFNERIYPFTLKIIIDRELLMSAICNLFFHCSFLSHSLIGLLCHCHLL
jgi:hypothetical protein